MKLLGKVVIPGMLAVSVLVGGCAQGTTGSGNHAQHKLANGDIQETTSSVNDLPEFLKGKPQVVVDTYRLAADNLDVLKWIPCYCGCSLSTAHKSNQNCFIKQIGADGKIVWDDHGTRCDVCLNITLQSIKMKKEGKSVKEIRAAIDQAYSNGQFAPPTKTDMPA